MKELIKNALDEAFDLFIMSASPIKREIKSVDISDIKPRDLTSFMKKNNIPDNAFFDGKDNNYDGWESGITLLSWEVEASTTMADILKNKKRFSLFAYRKVHEKLTERGYRRVGVNSLNLRKFKKTVLDMYLEKNFDELEAYYSLFFKKQ